MKDDKKKSVSLIMDKMMGSPKPVESEDGAELDKSIPLDTAAEELISALESKSAKGVAAAFKSLMELCESEPEAEAYEPEQPE